MFGPAPVTSATFPSRDTSNGYPSRALADLAHYPLICTRKWDLAWRIRPLWRIWYPLGSRILHVGHFLHDLFGLVAPVARSCTTGHRRYQPTVTSASTCACLPTRHRHHRAEAASGYQWSLGLATAPGPANAVLVIRTPPESPHTIYDTFDDEKRVI